MPVTKDSFSDISEWECRSSYEASDISSEEDNDDDNQNTFNKNNPVRTIKNIQRFEDSEQLDFEEEQQDSSGDYEDETYNQESGKERVNRKTDARSRSEQLEEGEVVDEEEEDTTSSKPRRLCSYYTQGKCTWGKLCRFLHSGVADSAHYSMFNISRALPVEDAVLRPSFDSRDNRPKGESSWERGLKKAKMLVKEAQFRREVEADYEEKKMYLTVGERDMASYARDASIIHDRQDAFVEQTTDVKQSQRRQVRSRFDSFARLPARHFESFRNRRGSKNAYVNSRCRSYQSTRAGGGRSWYQGSPPRALGYDRNERGPRRQGDRRRYEYHRNSAPSPVRRRPRPPSASTCVYYPSWNRGPSRNTSSARAAVRREDRRPIYKPRRSPSPRSSSSVSSSSLYLSHTSSISLSGSTYDGKGSSSSGVGTPSDSEPYRKYPMNSGAMDALKLSGQKQQIKLTLKPAEARRESSYKQPSRPKEKSSVLLKRMLSKMKSVQDELAKKAFKRVL